MFCGTRPANEDTTIHDLANIVAVWEMLTDNHNADIGRHYRYVMHSLRSWLDNRAKQMDRWDMHDLTDRSTDESDYVTSMEVTSTHLSDDIDQLIWSLKCIVGWSLWDAAVSYAYKHNDHDTGLSISLFRFKIDWENAIAMSKQLQGKDVGKAFETSVVNPD